MDFAAPPPNMSVPPPGLNMLGNPMGPAMGIYANKFDPRAAFNNRPPFRPFLNLQRLPGPLGNMTLEDFDGKRLRKSVMRKTVDYNSAIIKALENRIWTRDYRDRRALQPDVMYYPDMMPPPSYYDNPINCVTTRFVKTATNKMRCPIFCMAWTPEGRRLVTGASSGEFTLWNGLTFNFETILQAHDSPVRCMVWSHNDSWMVTGDHAGYVKYWQSNMNNVKMFQAHKEALRGISFSPMDSKFVTCSDDGTLRIWDFFRYQEERVLRGHGADVKCVHWHPQKGLIISGSKDNQQPIKLWDPKTGQSLATLHAHKSTVMDLKWNENGNWLITASRDHLLKLFDLRNLGQEVQTFRGHKKEASSVAWHPVHEGLFSSGGSDGAIMFWHVGADKEVGAIEQAHDSIVWTLAWHPLGHILCSGSNDHTSKFWTRNRPGDLMRDKYNLNTLPAGIAGLEDVGDLGKEIAADEPSVIPGMGPDDKVEFTFSSDDNATIPGLDLDLLGGSIDDKAKTKKVPYSKPIPRNFQAQWNETIDDTSGTLNEVLSQIVENTPGVVPLQKINPSAIIVAGKLIPVEPGSKLESAIAEGPDALNKFLRSGEVPELSDVMLGEDSDYLDTTYVDEDSDSHNQSSGPRPLMETPITPSKFKNQDFLSNRFGGGDGESSRHSDQDMRSHPFSFLRDSDMRGNSGDIDLRNNPNGGNSDFRNSRDFDMRSGPSADADMDEDYNRPYGQHQDFRNNRYNENEEAEEEYYEEEEDGYEEEEYEAPPNQNWPPFNGPRNNRGAFQNFRPGLPLPPPNDFGGLGQFNPGNNWNGSTGPGKDGFRGGRGIGVFRRNNLLGPPPPLDGFGGVPRPPLRGLMRGRVGRGIVPHPLLRRGNMDGGPKRGMDAMRRIMGIRGRGVPRGRNNQY
ncbi:pre-mRNA 3' end processing protein WDR33 [Agrilus planipennis]|uniref:Pre-mRNA 3' end processing protein WDR33 n=1 Tax=Agrilus planipennis TaxID=224129 RepID=A0A1W4X0A6_AGRPL|nr:pre-mRNA 3' end processing protein WDR33 [Agrilus planipennis]